MALLHWEEKYSVGVRQIDEEHKAIVAMINKAHDAINLGLMNETLMGEVIEDMAAYAGAHFATEDGLMKQYGFPLAAGHLEQHDMFFEQVEVFKASGAEKLMDAPAKPFRFLADWLVNHIMNTDKLLGDYLNQQGVK